MDSRTIRKDRHQQQFLDLIEKGVGRRKAVEEIGLTIHALKNWAREPDFRSRLQDADLVARGGPGQFPSFLAFREKHFAYIDGRTKTVKRAKNNWYQREANKLLETKNRALVILPPGHIKTTLFSIERTVYDIMRDRNFRATVIQKNADEASKLVMAVAERLQCPYYHWFIEQMEREGSEPIECPSCAYGTPPFRPDTKGAGNKWGAEAFTVQGRTSGEKDYTFQAKGPMGQIQGIRADRIILDDVQDPMQAIISISDTEKLVTWFKTIVMGRVFDYQQVLVLANYITPEDFAHRIAEEEPDFGLTTYPAILGNGKLLCPEVWTMDALKQKQKEVGSRIWHYTWMQEEGAFEDATFKREILESSRDPEYRLGERPLDVTDIYLGVDPAVAASGFCSVVAWGLNKKTKQRYLLDVFNKSGMMSWDNVIDAIIEVGSPFKGQLRSCVVELNNVQDSLINDNRLRRELMELGCQIKTYKTSTGNGARAEADNFSITTIGTLYELGLVTLPYGGPVEERERVDEYITQHCNWHTDDEGRSIKKLKRDMVMATLFGESEAYQACLRAERPPLTQRGKKNVPRWARNRDDGWSFVRPA